MVFCGKPSKACRQCRDRRLRCDLRTDGCSQCRRAHLKCFGYRNVEQLRIRDQSQTTATKARKNFRKYPQTVCTLNKPVLPSLEQRAQIAFFARYVSGELKTYDYLQSFYSSSSVDEHLSASINAVSLAHFSHRQFSPVILKQARLSYIKALRLTNAALRSPETAIKDTTLLATILLDLFEKFTSDQPRPKGSWTSHVNGALALISLRGKQQFSTYIGLRMVLRLSTSFLISFVACETSVPQEISEIRSYAAQYLDNLDPKWRITDLMVEYAAFCEARKAGTLSDSETIDLAMNLDSRYLEIINTMPPSWRYTKIELKSTDDRVFEDYFSQYLYLHITQTWNVARIIRILLNNTIFECSSRLCNSQVTADTSKALDYLAAASTTTIDTLAAEICATGPQYYGNLLASSTDNPSLSSTSTLLPGEALPYLQDSSQASWRCYTLIFPFYIAARYAPGSAVRNWVIKQLYYISDKFNIKNALVVAQILEKGEVINPWLVYVMLGSYAFVA